MSRKRGPEAGHYPTADERDERFAVDMPFDEAAHRLVQPVPADGDESTMDEREANEVSDSAIQLDESGAEDEQAIVERLEHFDTLVKDGVAQHYPSVREQLREYFNRVGL